MSKLDSLLRELNDVVETGVQSEEIVKKGTLADVHYVVRKVGDKFWGVAPTENVKSGPHDDPEAAEDGIREKLQKEKQPAGATEADDDPKDINWEHLRGEVDAVSDLVEGLERDVRRKSVDEVYAEATGLVYHAGYIMRELGRKAEGQKLITMYGDAPDE